MEKFFYLSCVTLCLVIVTSAAAFGATTLKDYKSDAEANLFYGDFFHSFRTYNYIESEKPDYFESEALDGYLKSLFVVGTPKAIEDECARFAQLKNTAAAAKADYLCGQNYVESKRMISADRYLKLIPRTSHFFWPGQILRATASLLSNDPAGGLKILNPADSKMYEKFGLLDEFDLSTARLLTAENRLDDAVRKYQAVDGKSQFYIDALEETAWVFFKMRRFESSQVLLDVLIGNYESSQRLGNQKVSDSTYFRARYLKAYLALTEKRTEGAAAAFADLKTEYEKNLISLRPSLRSEVSLSAIKDGNQKWTDVGNLPDALNEQLDLISQWEGADVRKRFENQIYYQMALTREIARTTRYKTLLTGDSADYAKTLQVIQDKTWKEFADQFEGVLKKLSKDLETLKVKAELGRLEIVWLKRAEGARSLDEVIENYRQEARAADEFLEK